MATDDDTHERPAQWPADDAWAQAPEQGRQLLAAAAAAFTQVPQIQQRHRLALAASSVDEAQELLDAWYGFHRQLVATRFSPAVSAIAGTERPSEQEWDEAVQVTAALTSAHAELVRALRVRVPDERVAAGRPLRPAQRWMLLRQYNGYLHSLVTQMLAKPAWNGSQASQLSALLAEHVLADSVLREAWPTDTDLAEDSASLGWVRHDDRVRELIELVVLGPLPSPRLPSAPPMPATRNGALTEVRARLRAESDDYPRLLAWCRATVGEMRDLQRQVRDARDGLLRLWGRYDDMMGGLHAWLASVRESAVTARLIEAELGAATQVREELVGALREADLAAEPLGSGPVQRAAAVADPRAGGPVQRAAAVADPRAGGRVQRAAAAAARANGLDEASPAVPHGLGWLPARPPVNPHALDLCLYAPWAPGRCAQHGVPTRELFLIGWAEPDEDQATQWLAAGQPPEDTAEGYVLRIRVPPGVAVPLAEAARHVPAGHRLLPRVPDGFLLPAGWLDGARIVAGGPAGQSGSRRSHVPLDAPLTIRCAGATHGVDGLPEDVPRWPPRRLRPAAGLYALVAPHASAADRPWLALYRRRPAVRADRWLVQLEVEPGQALDVAAAADYLAGLPAVNSSASRWIDAGIGLVLPAVAFPDATVTQLWHPDSGGWRRRRHDQVALADIGLAA